MALNRRILMHRRFEAAVSVLLVFSVTAGCKKKPEPPEDALAEAGIAPAARALWVREHTAVTSAVYRAELLAFCREQDVSTLLFYMRPFPDHRFNPAYVENLQRFVADVHERGMKVHAWQVMPTSPKLVYEKAQYVAVTYLRDFLKFNREQEAEHRFDGYVEAIAPHRLPGWEENAGGVHQLFVDLVREYYKVIIEFDQGLPLGWALPADYDEYEWFPELFEYLDYMVLTGLDDDPDLIVAQVQGELERAKASGTKVMASLETGPLKSVAEDGARGTFHGGNVEGMGRVMDEVARRLRDRGTFGGFAIHDYHAFAKLVRRSEEGSRDSTQAEKEN